MEKDKRDKTPEEEELEFIEEYLSILTREKKNNDIHLELYHFDHLEIEV